MGSGNTSLFRERYDIQPDEIRGSMARLSPNDRQLLHVMASRGADLTESTHVLAYLHLPTADSARLAAEELRTAFRSVRIDEPSGKQNIWAVVAETQGCLMPPNVQAMSAFCSAIAQRHEGIYDGWEAAIVSTDASMWRARFTKVKSLFRMFGRKREPHESSDEVFFER